MRLFGILNLLFFCTLAGAAEKAAKRTTPATKPLKPIPVEKVEPIPAEETPAPAVEPSVPALKPAYYLNGRGGLLLQAADPEVQDKWDHNMLESYLFSVGMYRVFPRSWNQFFFFAGFDFAYFKSEEEILSSNSNTYLTTTGTQLLVTGGASWFPRGGPFGFSFFTSFEILGTMETELQAEGFSKSLGKTKANEHNDSLIPLLAVLGLTAEYQWTDRWRPFVSYEIRNGNPITVGVNYGY